MASRERDLEIGGGTTSEEDGSNDCVFGDRRESNLGSRVVLPGVLCKNGLNSLGDFATENIELLIDKSSGDEGSQEHMALLETKLNKKQKKSSKKALSRPPRPPKGPALDAADMKLIRELSEMATRKRMRIERMRALKKMKAPKGSSSHSSLSAMIITLLFCAIIIFQGICNRSSSSMRFQGSPEPAVSNGEGLISVQYFKNPPQDKGSSPSSASINLVEHISGLSPEEGTSRVAG